MYKKLKSQARRYFGFSGTETKGFMVLAVLFPLVLIFPAFFKVMMSQRASEIHINTQRLDSLVALMEEKIALPDKAGDKKVKIRSIKLHHFDPNNVTFEEMLGLGIAPDIAHRIVNYRKKGGHFRVKKDLQKIYGLEESQFKRLKGCIDLPNQNQYEKKNPKPNKKNTGTSDVVPDFEFDINKIESEELMLIRGIGPVLSKRILKFRNILGGFVNINQLDEVYGLPDEVKVILNERGFVDGNFQPKQININNADVNDLQVHPYINNKLANQIVNYRKQHGNFKDLPELMNIHLIGKNDYDRLKPYLTL